MKAISVGFPGRQKSRVAPFSDPLERIDHIGPAVAVPNVNGGRYPSECIDDHEDANASPGVVLNLDGRLRIWLCTIPADMRRSLDGLSALGRNELGADPTSAT